VTTYALLPGAGGAAWYWHRVVPLLEAAGHQAVAIELPAADAHAGLAEYSEVAVAALTGSSGPVVVVAQSMGAFTAPLVATAGGRHRPAGVGEPDGARGR
jgi:alpha-beta hydrolase superfamily lysophospholipase